MSTTTPTSTVQKPVLIGLIGRAGSGKTTLARGLIELYKKKGQKAVEVSFAHHLKNVCAVVFDIYRPSFDDPQQKEMYCGAHHLTAYRIEQICRYFNVKDFPLHLPRLILQHGSKRFTTPREICQYVGTNLLRDSISETIHIDTALHLLELDPQHADVYIFSDVRFHNEFEKLEQQGAHLFGIERPSLPPMPPNAHASEAAIPELVKKAKGRTITNDGFRDMADFQEFGSRTIVSYIECP